MACLLAGWWWVVPFRYRWVCMCFTYTLISQGIVRFSVNINIQEGDVAICFGLHAELNVIVDAVEVTVEAIRLFPSVGPD
jgi:hypothetical protein